MGSSSSSINFFVTLLVVIILSFVSQGSAASKYALPFEKWRVSITNNQTSALLVVHCRSKDDDLGVHGVQIGGLYFWDFKENLWHTTLFWCEFESKVHGHREFEVYWPESGYWLQTRCGKEYNCIWAAKDDGIYLKNIPMNTFELQHRWVPWELEKNVSSNLP